MTTLTPAATARSPLRLLERRPARAPVVVRLERAPAPSASERLDRWLAMLPEPRNRLGATARV